MFGLPFDDQVLAKYARYMHYFRNRKGIVLKVDLLCRQYYNRVGNISQLQLLFSVQILAVFLTSLHSTASKHPVVSQMIQEKRRNYYIPSIAKYVRNWVQECGTCSNDKRIKNVKLEPELLNVPSWDMGPEDAMHTDLHPELPPSGDYESVFTARDVFSRYAFAYPVFTPTAVNTAKIIIDIMTRHANLPTLIITDKGSVFIPEVISEAEAVTDIMLKCATTRHARTI